MAPRGILLEMKGKYFMVKTSEFKYIIVRRMHFSQEEIDELNTNQPDKWKFIYGD